ncbi:diaminopimelate decarboxylase [Sporosarcina sp. P21c]|uniref:diaminopimelate decarboxylase n=1 Tax=unclassified Sporosarcina TaxID=2647733 RepID=UPI000C166E03|nr:MULTISPECIES: diaminopimelate decarboxylase [unclassified Sporosarcina]PIC68645.1 diaminopimelate decarboxylase [Sporosarcina sp. P16a]PIC84581.1 diaminopimelate decarboxylase [Sporosarcina sp. P1]PIC91169.1 diaminopimelate decarboxylase [Sporosarcina sp. P21c]PIC93698.1 diaminopimelate decarboxylase [Sporosarcina sp. P25]
MHLYGTQAVNGNGHLTIGGVDVSELAKQYGTPVMVYDTELFKERAQAFKETFEKKDIKAQVAYASKAFSSIAMYQLAEQQGLSLDVVSGGELYTAVAAGFPRERIHFHGNNKSREEIVYAFEENIGCIVVDNFLEIDIIKEIADERKQSMNVLIRVTPGIEAHTHDYITTGQEDSKFGFDLKNGQTNQAFLALHDHGYIHFLGMHCHIGSQIFETDAFKYAAEVLMERMVEWRKNYQFICPVLNLGGGFGIRYTEEDTPLEPAVYVEEMADVVKKMAEEYEYPIPEIWIEPGRSLVGDAGTTIYSAGSTKVVPGVRTYVAVDGGMSDNIRPALYDAHYSSALANRMNEPHDQQWTVAGKCCESGDKLIEKANLPKVKTGDLLAVFCTGAYTYSMASNYNRLPRPAVVFAEKGQYQLVVRRETYEDIIKLDLPLQSDREESF